MISGKKLSVNIDGVTIAGLQAWRVVESAHRLDGQTAKHEGYSADECGTPTATITLELVQDLTTGVYAAVRRGITLFDLALFRTSDDTAPAFYFPLATVMESENRGRVRDTFTTLATAVNYGPYEANDPGSQSEEEEEE